MWRRRRARAPVATITRQAQCTVAAASATMAAITRLKQGPTASLATPTVFRAMARATTCLVITVSSATSIMRLATPRGRDSIGITPASSVVAAAATATRAATITWRRQQIVPTTKLDTLRPHRHQSRRSRPHPQPPAQLCRRPSDRHQKWLPTLQLRLPWASSPPAPPASPRFSERDQNVISKPGRSLGRPHENSHPPLDQLASCRLE